MSRLAQAGDSSTVSPGPRGGAPRPRTAVRASRRRTRRVQTPRERRARCAARILADQHRVPHLAAERRGERREILALALAARDQHQRPRQARRPRRASRRRWCPWNRRRSARPRSSATHCERCARPGKDSSAASIGRRAASPRASPRASAASALAALCTPADFHARECRAAARRGAQDACCPPARSRVKSASARRVEKVTMRARRRSAAPRIAHTRGSSAFSTMVAALREDARLGARIRRPARRSGPCDPASR